MKTFQHFINGSYASSASGAAFDNVDPTDNSLIGKVCEGGRVEVDAAEFDQGIADLYRTAEADGVF